MEYLFGEGRAEEHTDPHIVAAHTDLLVGDRAGTAFARKALAGELDFHRVSLAPDVTEKFVFHAAVSMAAVDGPLPEAMWADVATSIAGHLGFAPADGPEVRWIAVHHGASAAGNDHIHLVANLITSDGRKHRFPRPPGVMLGEIRKELEIKHGLRQIGHTNGVDHGAGLGSHSRAETTRASREQQQTPAPSPAGGGVLEPESVRLERAVRAAAAGSGTEAEFVAELREQRVVVRPRLAAGSRAATTAGTGAAAAAEGQVAVGYSVALPTGGGGQQLLWFGGGRLAKDLTLPALRARWEHELDDATVEQARVAAVAVWRGTGEVGAQRRAAVGYPRRPDVVADLAATSVRIDALGKWARTAAAEDPEAAREAARAAAGLMAAAATRLSPAQQVPFHTAARALARLAQPERAGTRAAPGGRPTSHELTGPQVRRNNVLGAVLLHAATGAHQRAGWIAVYQALARTAAEVAAAHRSVGVALAETAAAEAAAHRLVVVTGADQAPPPTVDPRRQDTSFPISITEKLARARRAGTTTTPLKPSSPAPGQDRDRGHGL